jgi:plastocyanin
VLGAAALTVAAQTQAMSAPKLIGTVGPGFTISLKDATGKKVKTLKAGKYTFVITDKSPAHSFELEKTKGGKFEKELSGVGGQVKKKAFTITLTKGKWKVYCQPHESTMHQEFTVS